VALRSSRRPNDTRRRTAVSSARSVLHLLRSLVPVHGKRTRRVRRDLTAAALLRRRTRRQLAPRRRGGLVARGGLMNQSAVDIPNAGASRRRRPVARIEQLESVQHRRRLGTVGVELRNSARNVPGFASGRSHPDASSGTCGGRGSRPPVNTTRLVVVGWRQRPFYVVLPNFIVLCTASYAAEC